MTWREVVALYFDWSEAIDSTCFFESAFEYLPAIKSFFDVLISLIWPDRTASVNYRMKFVLFYRFCVRIKIVVRFLTSLAGVILRPFSNVLLTINKQPFVLPYNACFEVYSLPPVVGSPSQLHTTTTSLIRRALQWN